MRETIRDAVLAPIAAGLAVTTLALTALREWLYGHPELAGHARVTKDPVLALWIARKCSRERSQSTRPCRCDTIRAAIGPSYTLQERGGSVDVITHP